MSDIVETLRGYYDSLPTWGKAFVGTVALGASTAFTLYMTSGKRKRTELMKPDWKPGVVYLFQFPPVKDLPNISSYCLKVETWLRMKSIPFEVVDCHPMKTRSSEGMMPFVEVAGKEYHDSAFILEQLAPIFNVKEPYTSSVDAATARAFEQMAENVTLKSYYYIRYGEKFDEIFTEKILGQPVPTSFKIMSFFLFSNKAAMENLRQHGIGRHTRDEVVDIGKRDLRALSDLLGGKKFMMGDTMSTMDATIFSVLAQMVYLPIETPHLEYIKSDCHNLLTYTDRVRDACFPDWGQIFDQRKKFFDYSLF